MGDKASSKPLRLMTYLSPDIPINLFELFRDFLEKKTGMKGYLITESRWDGPPDDRTDPLTGNDADILFLSSSAFLDLKDRKKNQYMELCGAGPVHINPRASEEPVCFSDIVILSSKVTQQVYKDFESLRGSRWAYCHKNSITGSLAMLSELKKRGYNANFFGNSFESGSHLKSIQMLQNGQVDVASVSSVVMAAYRISHPQRAEGLSVLCSLGPFPIYTIVFNSRLPTDLKNQMTKALQTMGTEDGHKWAGQFLLLGVKGFARITEESFTLESDVTENVKNMSIAPAYY
ncbi:hypothetical protein ACOMHN_019411 [Nucella lapillus]